MEVTVTLSLKVATPAVTTTPPAVTLKPVLAVIRPTESTLVTSSYVKVPATDNPAPIYTFLATPKPPVTITEPVVDDVESVESVTASIPPTVAAPPTFICPSPVKPIPVGTHAPFVN